VLNRIKAFFETEIHEDSSLSHDKINLACAALLIEVATIDQEFDDKEFIALKNILVSQYNIAESECDAIAELARQECEDSTSMYQFTQLVNTHCNHQDKYNLIKGMWTIAYADGDLDKYEEYIIRKTCELLHVAHSDFIRAKHDARAPRQ